MFDFPIAHESVMKKKITRANAVHISTMIMNFEGFYVEINKDSF